MEITKCLLNKKEYLLKIIKKKDSQFEIILNGKTKLATILKQDTYQNILFIKIHNTCYKAHILMNTDNTISLYIENLSVQWDITLEELEEKKITPAELVKPKIDQEDQKHITSPLAGKIIKVCVTPHQFVTKNKTLVIIESMKMENEIRATDDSFIKTVLIKESDLVQQNQLLITFDKRRNAHVKSKNKNEQKTI
jgi:biotin carboxyl carrier protein